VAVSIAETYRPAGPGAAPQVSREAAAQGGLFFVERPLIGPKPDWPIRFPYAVLANAFVFKHHIGRTTMKRLLLAFMTLAFATALAAL
jgi:hypothetical protein